MVLHKHMLHKLKLIVMYMYGGPFETCMVEHVIMVEQLACVGTSEKEEGCLVRVSWAVHYAKYVQLYISAQKGYR